MLSKIKSFICSDLGESIYYFLFAFWCAIPLRNFDLFSFSDEDFSFILSFCLFSTFFCFSLDRFFSWFCARLKKRYDSKEEK